MSSDDTRRLILARRARFIQLGLGLTLAGTSGSFACAPQPDFTGVNAT